MKLFRRKKVDAFSPFSLRDIAQSTLYARQSFGFLYRDGVVDEAVRRAIGVSTNDDLIDVFEAVFLEYERVPEPSASFLAALDHLGVFGLAA